MPGTATKTYSVERSKAILKSCLKFARNEQGYKGSDDLDEFREWAEKNEKAYESKNGVEIDLKALVLTPEGPTSARIDFVEDDEDGDDVETLSMDEEEEETSGRSGTKSKRIEELETNLDRMRANLSAMKKQLAAGRAVPALDPTKPPPVVTSVKSGAERYYAMKCEQGRSFFNDIDHAVMFGHMLAGALTKTMGDAGKSNEQVKKLQDLMDRKGYNGKAYTASSGPQGGFLVPEELSPEILRNLDEFGVARQAVRVYTSTTGEFKRPRNDNYLQGYYPDEGQEATADNQTFALDTMNAKMVFVLAKMSRQVLDDANLDLIDDVAGEIVRTIARIEDETLFNGTGVPGTYIPDVQGILPQVGTTAADDSRSHTGAGSADLHDLTDVMSAFAKVAPYARNQNTAWYASPALVSIILHRISGQLGGVTMKEWGGKMVPFFAGYPVIEVNVMPSAVDAGGDQLDLIVGDMSRAAMMLDRMGIEIDSSEQAFWKNGQVAIRGLARHDMNIHSLGSTTARGPLGFLWQT